nr:hypothetical protein [Tanacetum cinerariifolium]
GVVEEEELIYPGGFEGFAWENEEEMGRIAWVGKGINSAMHSILKSDRDGSIIGGFALLVPGFNKD